jgi:cytochrome c5
VPEAAAPAPAPGPAATADEGRLLVEHKCGKCHDVSLAFSSELSDASWKLHMKRMANRPGAAISDDQARKIHGFLKDNAARSASR